MCPFVNTSEARCAETLTLANIERALELCAGQYQRCEVYCELQAAASRCDQTDAKSSLAAAG